MQLKKFPSEVRAQPAVDIALILDKMQIDSKVNSSSSSSGGSGGSTLTGRPKKQTGKVIRKPKRRR